LSVIDDDRDFRSARERNQAADLQGANDRRGNEVVQL
jgi:hypothetical protein